MRVRPPYSLQRTLQCGQVFRWTVRDGVATGIFRGRVWTVRQEGPALRVSGGDPGELEALMRHLAVDAPLRSVERALSKDPVLRRALEHTSGIAIMRQDPWECLVSYVVSAFNNIPKIRLTVERLSRRFGRPLADGRFAFPTPKRLADASLPALRACLLGYRAPYVRAVARAVTEGRVDLEALRVQPYPQARKVLLALPGVGEKVAECVLLFALGHGEAFPVDVWVQRAVEAILGRPAIPREIRQWARDRFGPLAGYANQHLFVAARMGILGRSSAV
ncbi:MAG: DNA glycosylase [Armatimonadota bacterium]|nr:DNA glycosylase [Armatimonadota bacterium]MDR7464120.1 DNA glycosylase [Armatimonadota bacterium]MDR7470852.1 DNA glycosylase [Armatimonadota bacterium]MDR7473893.1 DNA glycosylase [Armatimonadota bacterium]MDR7540059.1 DNA glycosylase [Armatimonadota bacterium]